MLTKNIRWNPMPLALYPLRRSSFKRFGLCLPFCFLFHDAVDQRMADASSICKLFRCCGHPCGQRRNSSLKGWRQPCRTAFLRNTWLLVPQICHIDPHQRTQLNPSAPPSSGNHGFQLSYNAKPGHHAKLVPAINRSLQNSHLERVIQNYLQSFVFSMNPRQLSGPPPPPP